MQRTWLVATLVGLLAGCGRAPEAPVAVVEDEIATRAIAVVRPAEGFTGYGTVTFDREGTTITVTVDLDGMTPGLHGFHIHTYGDLSAADLTSAGGHFDPEGKPHGASWSAERHVGDLGNVTANVDGHVHTVIQDSIIAFYGPHSIIGRAVIVHENEDDLFSQPTGNAGARVAGGVIGIAESMPAVAVEEEQGQ